NAIYIIRHFPLPMFHLTSSRISAFSLVHINSPPSSSPLSSMACPLVVPRRQLYLQRGVTRLRSAAQKQFDMQVATTESTTVVSNIGRAGGPLQPKQTILSG